MVDDRLLLDIEVDRISISQYTGRKKIYILEFRYSRLNEHSVLKINLSKILFI
jgi:hypothetical protein